MHGMTILFKRETENLIAMLSVYTDEPLTQEQVMFFIEKAINKWIETCESGLQAWEYSSEDFNIGDWSSYIQDAELKACLKEQGIVMRNIEMFASDEIINFDKILASPTLEEL